MELYIITVDWYNEDEGHNHQVLDVVETKEKALEVFREYVDTHRDLDKKDGYKVIDDTEFAYYAHGAMPEYHRVLITFWN